MENTPFESSFFGSGVLWMLLTFPAYWLFQWTVERAPFDLWPRRAVSAVNTAGDLSHAVTQSIVQAGATLIATSESPSPATSSVDPFCPAAID